MIFTENDKGQFEPATGHWEYEITDPATGRHWRRGTDLAYVLSADHGFPRPAQYSQIQRRWVTEWQPFDPAEEA